MKSTDMHSKGKRKPLGISPLSAAVSQIAHGQNIVELPTTGDDKSAWTEINDLNGQCKMLILSCIETKELLGNKALCAKLKDPVKVTVASNILLRDLQNYTNKLNVLGAKHQGVNTAGWDITQVLQLSEDYFQWMNSFQQVVLPNMVTITDAFNEIDQQPKA